MKSAILSQAKELEAVICNAHSNLDFKGRLEVYNQYLSIIQKRAYRGIPVAQYEYAQQFEDSTWLYLENPKRNVKKAFFWYSKACKNNFPAACNNLAHYYELGIGCKKNLSVALKLYRKASELGDNNGKSNYKIMMKQMQNQS